MAEGPWWFGGNETRIVNNGSLAMATDHNHHNHHHQERKKRGKKENDDADAVKGGLPYTKKETRKLTPSSHTWDQPCCIQVAIVQKCLRLHPYWPLMKMAMPQRRLWLCCCATMLHASIMHLRCFSEACESDFLGLG